MSKQLFRVKVCKAQELPKMDIIGHADPYVVLKLDGRTRQTEFIKNQKNPVWNVAFEWDFPIKEDLKSKVLQVDVYDHDIAKEDDWIGKVTVPLESYLKTEWETVWLDIVGENGRTGDLGKIQLELGLRGWEQQGWRTQNATSGLEEGDYWMERPVDATKKKTRSRSQITSL